MRMSKFWRTIAPIVAAGGLVASVAIPAASASPAAYTMTISAKSAIPLISGHTLVVYKTKGFQTATIFGDVTGFAPGDLATLWAKPFGATAYKATSSTQTLAATSPNYSFSVQPSRATAYEVQITTGMNVDITSTPVTVYVTQGGRYGAQRQTCGRTTCTYSYRIFEYLPASAYRIETRKHIYLYLAVGYPRLPGRYTLDPAATATHLTKINPGEFRVTLTFVIALRRGSAQWVTNFCTKDTESLDGLGLPGHHGCGNRYISRRQIYVG
jgi:hypothetical protein